MEVDGRRLELPADLAGVMLLNIPSYMGGVDLWAGGDAPAAAGSAAPQSFSDATLEARAASAPTGRGAQRSRTCGMLRGAYVFSYCFSQDIYVCKYLIGKESHTGRSLHAWKPWRGQG